MTRPQGYFPAPPLAAPLDVDPPPLVFTTHTLDNGLKVMIVPNHEVPFVSATLGLLAGGWTDAKPGTASMTLDMLTKGTKHHNEEQLSDELGTYAINLSGTAGMDSARSRPAASLKNSSAPWVCWAKRCASRLSRPTSSTTTATRR